MSFVPLRIGVSVWSYKALNFELAIHFNATFQRKRYISIARTGNFIMYNLNHNNGFAAVLYCPRSTMSLRCTTMTLLTADWLDSYRSYGGRCEQLIFSSE